MAVTVTLVTSLPTFTVYLVLAAVNVGVREPGDTAKLCKLLLPACAVRSTVMR
jgi:hypothetical protein